MGTTRHQRPRQQALGTSGHWGHWVLVAISRQCAAMGTWRALDIGGHQWVVDLGRHRQAAGITRHKQAMDTTKQWAPVCTHGQQAPVDTGQWQQVALGSTRNHWASLPHTRHHQTLGTSKHHCWQLPINSGQDQAPLRTRHLCQTLASTRHPLGISRHQIGF